MNDFLAIFLVVLFCIFFVWGPLFREAENKENTKKYEELLVNLLMINGKKAHAFCEESDDDHNGYITCNVVVVNIDRSRDVILYECPAIHTSVGTCKAI